MRKSGIGTLSWVHYCSVMIACAVFMARAGGEEDIMIPYRKGFGQPWTYGEVLSIMTDYEHRRWQTLEGSNTTNATVIAPVAPTLRIGHVEHPAHIAGAVASANVKRELEINQFRSRASKPRARDKPQEMWGTIVRVGDPLSHYSVYTPPMGCGTSATVGETSQHYGCVVATNAGFFNTSSYECHGDIVSDGNVLQKNGRDANVNFGITRDNKFIVGYLNHTDFDRFQFAQLVTGYIWLVKEGEMYVDGARFVEDEHIQETGPSFVTVLAGRTAIGHDREGRLLLATIDGATHNFGASLYDLAALMLEAGAVNAINLDGGGSTSMFYDGHRRNFPSDHCHPGPRSGSLGYGLDAITTCARRVTTVICIHNSTATPTPTPTSEATNTVSASATPTQSGSSSVTPTSSNSATPSPRPTTTPTETPEITRFIHFNVFSSSTTVVLNMTIAEFCFTSFYKSLATLMGMASVEEFKIDRIEASGNFTLVLLRFGGVSAVAASSLQQLAIEMLEDAARERFGTALKLRVVNAFVSPQVSEPSRFNWVAILLSVLLVCSMSLVGFLGCRIYRARGIASLEKITEDVDELDSEETSDFLRANNNPCDVNEANPFLSDRVDNRDSASQKVGASIFKYSQSEDELL